MIRLGDRIRLTRREVERLTLVTAMPPPNVRCFGDLDTYVRRCKAHYWGSSHDTQFLHWLIDREVQRCVQAA
jgi:hypothetical protein